jgi:hypothetical protein
MTLEELYYISQIVAVIAIFASLIFVGVQVRQNSEQIKANTRSIKAAAAFEGTHSWATTNEMIVADVSDAFLLMAIATYDPGKGWHDFAEADRARVTLAQRALFQKLEGLYFLYKYGNLDKALWEARLSWAAGVIKLPFYRQWWEFEKTQNIWSAEFVATIEMARDTTNVVPWDVSALHSSGATAPETNPQGGAPTS